MVQVQWWRCMGALGGLNNNRIGVYMHNITNVSAEQKVMSRASGWTWNYHGHKFYCWWFLCLKVPFSFRDISRHLSKKLSVGIGTMKLNQPSTSWLDICWIIHNHYTNWLGIDEVIQLLFVKTWLKIDLS